MNCKECEEETLESTQSETSSEAECDIKLRQNYHEKTENRNFLIKIWKNEEEYINFYIDLKEFERVSLVLPEYSRDDELEFVHERGIKPENFHKFLESALPTIYGLRPVPISMSNICGVLDILEVFPCEPLLTNCERFLMKIDLTTLEGSVLINILSSGLKSNVDHKILNRIVCICLLNPAKLSNSSVELCGNVGGVFAQAFVANATKSFRHVKPLKKKDEREDDKICPAVRSLMMNKTIRKKSDCNHEQDETSFQCILCFDVRCPKCKGENAYCFKAIDNFLYDIRLRLFPKTYRPHCDRESRRDHCSNQYIYRNQLRPPQE